MFKPKALKVACATSAILLLIILPHYVVLSKDRPTSIDVTQFYLDSNCKVKCHSSSDGCRNTPSRKDICRALGNANWCCQEWTDTSTSQMLKAASNTAPDGTCPAAAQTNCRTFDGRPRQCRLSCNCAYNCASGKCKDSKEVSDKPCFSGCWNHCQDRCRCKGNIGCSYDPGTGICKSHLERYCKLTHFTGTECGRKGAYYIVGDAICQNMVQMGYCALDMVLVSANLGSDKVVKDSQGIEYKAENDIVKEDPFGISKSVSFSAGDIKADKEKDKNIYASAVTGNEISCTNRSKKCIDYTIPVMNWEGDYELALRMHEGVYDKKGKRRFSAYFANVELFSELDIMSYTEEKFRPLDLIVNFRVTDQGKTITLKGRQPIQLGSRTTLSLCTGECGKDNGFLVSAFHIIKQQLFRDQESCDTSKPLEECGDFHKDACRRKNAIYSFDGKFCKSTKQAGNCYISDQLLAINFNGAAMVDSRGIEYQSEDGTFYWLDSDKSRLAKQTENALDDEQDGDRSLYSGVIYGDPSKISSCLSYLLEPSEDGRYELAIRLVDDESDEPGQRKFAIRIRTDHVFNDVDIFHLSGGKKGKPVDIHFNFEIIGNTLRWRENGEDKEVATHNNRQFYVSFCTFSPCTKVKKTNYMVAAMSVVMFGEDPERSNTPCTKHHGDPCGCRYEALCEYNVVAEKCYGRKAVCAQQYGWRQDRDCRRGSEHIYYAYAGMVCQNKLDTMEKCKVKDTLIAVNLGQNTRHTDIYGIYYKQDIEILYDDPDKIRITDGPRYDILNKGIPRNDLPLYNYFMYTDWRGGKKNPRCITYKIPVKEDGLHQLSLKVGELYTATVKKRAFSIKVNGQYLVREFEYAQYRHKPYGFDLNTNYLVYGAGTRMLMDGHPASAIASKSIPLSLCFGNCDWPEVRSYMLGAFSVVRFNRTVPCHLKTGDACGCQALDKCQFNTATKECVETANACKMVRGGISDCRRAGEHVYYADAGIICPSTKSRGRCEVAETVVADNYDKPETTDSNGISFHAGNSLLVEDPKQSMVAGGYDGTVEGIPAADQLLYKRMIFGKSSASSYSCVTFYVPTSGDGSYELRLRPFQKWYRGKRQLEFDIMFNGQYIVKAFDIESILPFPKAFELNVHFKILAGGTKLQMSGHPPSDITKDDKTIPLVYCYGKCSWGVTHGYSMAAMSVVKFKGCSDFNNDPCSCRGFKGCEFNSVNQTCGERDTACSKISYGNDDTCWRGGPNVFYFHGGIVCPNVKGSGNCQVADTMYDQTFNGRPPSTRLSKKKKNCYRQVIQLDGDGEYELRIRSREVYYEQPDKSKKRSLNYKFNGQYVVQQFDTADYRKHPTIVELNVQFSVSGGGTKLQMRGYPETNLDDDTVVLSVCSDDCGEEDSIAQLSGVSVVKFKTVGAR